MFQSIRTLFKHKRGINKYKKQKAKQRQLIYIYTRDDLI